MRVKSQKDLGFRISDCGLIPPNPQSRVPAGCRNPQSQRFAMTLIELLAVIIILTTVRAAAVPILAPADSDRAIREATRGLNTAITFAQAKAIQLRRPFGIALKKLSLDTDTDNNPNNPHDDNAVCVEV